MEIGGDLFELKTQLMVIILQLRMKTATYRGLFYELVLLAACP